MNIGGMILAGSILVLAGSAAIQSVAPDPTLERTEALIAKAETLTVTATSAVSNVAARVTPFLEIDGRGVVTAGGPFQAGGTVPIQFLLRRNKPCATDIEVRFARAPEGSIDTSLTYVIPATRAPITADFQTFTVSVRLPEGMAPGRYAYTALAVASPFECPEERPVTTLSEYFDVIEKQTVNGDL